MQVLVVLPRIIPVKLSRFPEIHREEVVRESLVQRIEERNGGFGEVVVCIPNSIKQGGCHLGLNWVFKCSCVWCIA